MIGGAATVIYRREAADESGVRGRGPRGCR